MHSSIAGVGSQETVMFQELQLPSSPRRLQSSTSAALLLLPSRATTFGHIFRHVTNRCRGTLSLFMCRRAEDITAGLVAPHVVNLIGDLWDGRSEKKEVNAPGRCDSRHAVLVHLIYGSDINSLCSE